MKNTKTFKVVMLSTEKSNNVGDIVMRPSDKRLAILNVLTVGDPQECINQHLYIISDDEIGCGDWYLDQEKNKTFQYSGNSFDGILQSRHGETSSRIACKKIIASTKFLDIKCEELSECHDQYISNKLPVIPESFVNAYIKAHNEGFPITEIDLEMYVMKAQGNGTVDTVTDMVKTRPDGSVIIHQSTMYSKEDVIKILRDAHLDIVEGNYKKGLNKWIEENL